MGGGATFESEVKVCVYLKVQRKDEHRARLMIGPRPPLIISSTLPVPIGRGLEG